MTDEGKFQELLLIQLISHEKIIHLSQSLQHIKMDEIIIKNTEISITKQSKCFLNVGWENYKEIQILQRIRLIHLAIFVLSTNIY